MSVRPRHKAQLDVQDFHRALGIPIGDSPAIRRPELRAGLIEEEAAETVEAIHARDLVATIDGLCDLLVTAYSAAVEFGLDLAPFWDEVHRTNMAKRNSPAARLVKPPGWTPPDIAGVLRREHGRVAEETAA